MWKKKQRSLLSPYRFAALDEDLGPSEAVLGGMDGQVPEQMGHTLDGKPRPRGPRVDGQHLVSGQEGLVVLAVSEAYPAHAYVLKQAENEIYMYCHKKL